MSDYLDWRLWLGRFLRRRYLAALDRRLRVVSPQHRKRALKAIRKDCQSIYEENGAWLVDRPAKLHLMLTSLVLATYRVVVPIVGDREAVVEIIRSALADPMRRWTRLRMFTGLGISPWSPQKAFEQISRNIKRRGERLVGSCFVYEQELRDEQFSLNIRRCFFHDFFVAHGAPELTGVFCALDNFWADELKKEKYGVRFERPATFALGGDVCRWQFTRLKGGERDDE